MNRRIEGKAIADVTGSDLLQIANECWDSRQAEYRGLYFRRAVAEAMEADDKIGRRKVRRDNAVELVSVLFDKARKRSPKQLDSVVYAAANDETDDDLTSLATEVVAELHGVSAGQFGVIDIGFVVALITAIIGAIKQCREFFPGPTPTPVPVPTP